MKTSRILAGALLAGGLWSSSAFSQVPAAPAAPAAAAGVGADGAAAAVKPGICEKIDAALDRKRRKLCQIPLGGMLNSITKPLTAATGGIIPGFCPSMPSTEDQKKPGAQGAAAQLMADAVEAAARRKAVRLMGTFDCHWYPEAEEGLAKALRTDRAECVRLEAAIALNRGCCCTRMIVEALEDCVGGMDKLGPSENSPRVQMVAQMALERCLSCPEATMIEEVAPPPADEKDKTKESGGQQPLPQPRMGSTDPGSAKPMNPTQAPPALLPPTGAAPTVKKGSGKPSRELLEHAKRTLAMAKAHQANHGGNPLAIGDEPLPAGQRSLAGLANYVVNGGSKPAPVQTAMPPVAQPVAQPIAKPTYAPISQPIAQPVAPPKATAPVVRTPEKPTPVVAEPVKFKPISTTSAAEPGSPRVDPTVLRNLDTLRNAPEPEARHKAVQWLAGCNWREHPAAISGLIYAARTDKHAGLRVACIRSLAKMKAGTPEVITGLKPMTNDPDEWIRHETTQALNQLQALAPTQTASLR
jgi:hypothetical protein